MERCPVCRARVNETSPCPRCGADLTLVLRLEARRWTLERQAVSRLRGGDPAGAGALLAQARRVQRTPLNLVLSGFVRGLQRQMRLPALPADPGEPAVDVPPDASGGTAQARAGDG